MENVMQEIQQVVVLAAGRSRRMEDLSRRLPKCLLPYKGEQILKRTVRQIKAAGVHKIVITIGYRADEMHKLFDDDPDVILVENTNYEEDVNIYSMSLALSHIDGPCAIFEADTVMEDALVNYVCGSDFEGKSVWFTKGRFRENQYGGILKSNKYGQVTDVRIVPSWQESYRTYSKLSGIMRVGPDEIELFRALVNKYARTTLRQYFLNAWIENIKLLPSWEADISPFQFFTFNKPAEYYQMQESNIGVLCDAPEVQMVPVEGLKHVEDFDQERVDTLRAKIESEGIWDTPIIVDMRDHIVMDGQHRMEVAKAMGLVRIPAIVVDYSDVLVWTLRKEYKVSLPLIRRRVREGNVYPYKTVKHKFNFYLPKISVPLDELR